ncbi:BTAD domain-containing putative transcriptional regulator [Streptomyces sp. NPDC056486]|uniref:AfsR/SARP family transcriptional regulator n=1 Tax=Streptomyces sp. NPDC056486 TaxID=3345835 RepID=UPI0036973436
MRLQLLGPVRAWRDDAELALGPPKQLAVVGLLASRANEVVHVEEIIDAVWGSDVPRTAVNGVHTYVGGLRRVLEPERGSRETSGLLVSSSGGYFLRLAPEEVDAHVFARRHSRARRLRADGDLAGAIGVLETALPLWHGDAFASVPGPFADMERIRLQELRLSATEEWAYALLALGRHSEVWSPLSALMAREPLREKLRWLLMLSLYRCGRRAEALNLYHDTRILLRDQLGIEPGRDLSLLHQQMLSDHPDLGADAQPDGRGSATAHTAASADDRAPAIWSAVRPAQLPPIARGFTGRAAEKAQLIRLATDSDGTPSGRTTMAVVTGPPGVGKSGLALRVAYDLADQFPDGQLYVDLCGTNAHREPLTATEALAQVLRSLGIDETLIPGDLAGRTALYRSLLYGKRTLLVLDDAYAADQLRPLIPQGPAYVLITSRWRHSGLVARDGAYRVELSPLSPEESMNLLACLTPLERMKAEADDIAALTRLCGHLPLALRIIAEMLATMPHVSAHEFVKAVADRRMDRLDVVRDAAASLRSAFARSYRTLSPDVSRMFRLLGLCEGATITADAAATLAGTDVGHARRLLQSLAEAHLLMETGEGTYRFQELIGAYANECSDEEPVPARTEALDRALRLYARHDDAPTHGESLFSRRHLASSDCR